MKEKVKVGFCVAYDWYLLRYSLPLVYQYTDKICLSLDKERISWSLNQFQFDDDAFRDLINGIDREGKVTVLEEDYHLPSLTPMENEVRQRNRMAEFMGMDGWHVQLDCDEYFLDFEAFTRHLRTLSPEKYRGVNICCAWIVLFKRVEGGFLYVHPDKAENIEYMQFATRMPSYEYSRRNGNFNIFTNFRVLHQSWARSENEIREKLNNWGHSKDLDPGIYLEKWKSINIDNYQRFCDLHPLHSSNWPRLAIVKGNTINDVIVAFRFADFPFLSRFALTIKNSRTISRLTHLSKQIWRILA
jgi:hypothetical protein